MSGGRNTPAAPISPTPRKGKFSLRTYLVEALERRTLLSAGNLDPTFGTNGVAIPFPAFASGDLIDAERQPTDGKIVALVSNSSGSASLVRIATDGSPDLTFGSGGMVSLGTFQASGIGLLSTGDIIVARPNSGGVELQKYSSTGVLDQNFASGGSDFLSFEDDFFFNIHMAVRPDDRIIVTTDVNGGSNSFALFSVAPDDGPLNFGVVTPLPPLDTISSLVALSDNRILATGSAGSTSEIAVFTSAGAVDTSFGNGGTVVVPNIDPFDYSIDVTEQSDGKIVVAGEPVAGDLTYTRRFLPDGTADSTFGSGGTVIIPHSSDTEGEDGDVTVDSVGHVLVGGEFGIARFNADGTLDTGYGGSPIAHPSDVESQKLFATVGRKLQQVGVGPDGLQVAQLDNSELPTASVTTAPAIDRVANKITATVTYTGFFGIDPASIGAGDLRLQNGTIYNQTNSSAQVLSTTDTSITVEYFFDPPGGSFDDGDAGTYVLSVEPTQVSDTDANFAPAQNLGSFAVTVPPPLPDLAFADNSFTSGTYASGESIPANIVPTQSGIAAAFTTKVVLSTDQTLSDDDIPLFSTDTTTAGEAITSLGPIPSTIAVGNYFLIEAVDPAGAIPESNEANNTFVSPTASITIAAATVGGLDPTFGNNGVIRPVFNFSSVAGVIQQPDGKILYAGTAGDAGNGDIGLSRLNANTTNDGNFGTSNGVATVDIRGTDDRVTAVKLLSDGRILVAGISADPSGGGSDFFVARFTAAGALDTTFGKQGTALIDFSSLVAPGAGSVDSARSLLVRADGSIVVAGRAGGVGGTTDFAIARLSSNGALDTSFGTGGLVVTDFFAGDDSIQALTLAANGSLLAAGYSTQSGARHIALAQYLNTGALDPSFGVGGKLVTSAGGTGDQANDVALGAKGQIVIVGPSFTGTPNVSGFTSNFFVARFSSKGQLDKKFGTGGIARADFGQPASARSVQIDASGRILVSGITGAVTGADSFDLALARFLTTGAPDTSFGATGITVVKVNSNQASNSIAHAQALVAQPAAASGLADALDAFTDATEGQIGGLMGGGALVAATSGTATATAKIVINTAELSDNLIAKLPASLLGGSKGTAAVAITNVGDIAAVGSVSIQFFVSKDQVLTPDDQMFFTLSGQSINLKPLTDKGKPKSFKAKFTYPTTVPDGTYFLLAEIVAPGIKEANTNNNSASTFSAVQIAAPFVDLTGSSLAGGVPLTAGKTAVLSLKLTNDGNIKLAGNSSVSVILSENASANSVGAANVPAIPLKLSLAANASKTVKIKVPVPAVPAGEYFLFFQLDPANTIKESDETNNLLPSVGTSPLAG